jgi:hypothetical protein
MTRSPDRFALTSVMQVGIPMKIGSPNYFFLTVNDIETSAAFYWRVWQLLASRWRLAIRAMPYLTLYSSSVVRIA